ncbi:putative metalloprotease CJM1_0395 family protein [Marinicellulosiphila megalodicopiae]|uniref:putative metalloprotease CJM1_0395 family protein n=1 Tax=Marinicellulosiphila megalodicopiae TaxID=2724896 RepID=UPI003BB15452
MSTINGVYANAITPVAPRPQSDNASNQSPAHEQFAKTTFVPVEASQQNDATKSSSDQRPEHDHSRNNQQNVQNEQNQKQVDEKQLSTKEMIEQKIEAQLISQLKSRDMEVRNHEMAHKIVGGKYAGAINLQYTKGPDGMNYASAGEVSISISPLNDPQMTIQKMRQIKQAALAPSEPSSQDRSVAAMATQIEIKAYTEMAKMERAEEQAKEQAKEEMRTEADNKNDKSESRNTQSSDDTVRGDKQSDISDDVLSADERLSEIESSHKSANTEFTSQPTGLNLNVIA